MQGAFDTITGLFDKVVFRKNVRKMVGMICHPCRSAGTQSEAAADDGGGTNTMGKTEGKITVSGMWQ